VFEGERHDAPDGDRASVPILMYHEVSPRRPASFAKYVVSPRAFARQMRWLGMAGYAPISLDTLLANRVDGAVLPRRAVVITFDDGFHDCAYYAANELQRHGFPAAFFLVAGLIGKTSDWLMRERGVALRMADWPRARELVAAGFACGGHSLTHPRLADLADAACRRELEDSRRILEDGLGREVIHLAYPYGSFSARTRSLAAEAGYRTACTVEVGASTSHDDLLALRRVPVSGFDSLADFASRLHTGLSLRDACRTLVRRSLPTRFRRRRSP
jgi:peptidoglycan/xylan/chitin deacetylase (PgdA/CDA1 family)